MNSIDSPPLTYPSTFTQINDLLDFLDLDRAQLTDLDPAPPGFGLRVPRAFAERMQRGDPADPLLRQVLPLTLERQAVDGYIADPVADAAAERAPGLLVKYAGRALLLVTGACALHCRYCFRRHFPYQDFGPSPARLERALTEIARDPQLTEVVLSGGDPLLLDVARLNDLIERLEQIPTLTRLRLHSRVPVAIPSRLSPHLAERLSASRLQSTLVIHANHAHELDASVCRVLHDWRAAGVTLLNQSVLLRGVNDCADSLIALSERLFTCGVLPYYLHALDPVAGSAHFQVSDATAKLLLETVRARLPGYLVPRLVRELPGDYAKRPLD